VRGAPLALLIVATMLGGTAAAEATPGAAAPVQTDSFPRKDVPALVKDVFAREISFCHDPRYPLTRDEVKWCALLPKDDSRCPELARACSRGATAELVGQRAHRQPSTSTVSFPTAPLPLRALLWVLLAVIVAVVIYAIAKQALGQSAPATGESVEVATAPPEDPAAAIARQIETDVQRLLERARAAAAAGHYADAVGDAYAALLRKLEGAGVVNVESHRTNGDHVRDVGRQLPALRPRMQAVVNNVEEVQFGGGDASESRFRSVMMDVVGLLNERLAVLLPLLVKLALGVGLAGLLAGCNFDRERDHWDRSTSGHVLVVDLLQRYGFTPRERLAPLAKLDKTVSSLVLLPGASVDDTGWQAVAHWIGEGGTLFIAGGDRTMPAWLGATIVADPPSTSTSPAKEPLRVPSDQASRLPPVKAVVPGDRQIQVAVGAAKPQAYSDVGDEGDAPPAPLLFRGRTLYAVERTYQNGGRAVVLADDHLLANVSLLVGDNALLLVELLRPGGQKLEIAGELTGLVAKDPVTSVQRSRLAPALLQLLLLLVLFFVYKGAHFGRPIDPIETKRRAFSEHARAIGLQYGRRRAGRHALELYGGYALERMRERLNLSGGKGMLAVAEEVATRTGRPLGDVMRVLVESRPPNQPPADLERDAAIQEATSAKDLATLRDIATLLQRGTLGGSHTPREELRQAQPAVAHAPTTTGGAGERIGAQRKT
jgi:hypothetical protein